MTTNDDTNIELVPVARPAQPRKRRLWRALTAGAVGASLALAGGYLQGLFRNGLASPSVVGVTAGSVLGGTPGEANVAEQGNLPAGLAFNEVADVDLQPLWVELTNLSDAPVDLDGYIVATSAVSSLREGRGCSTVAT